MLDVPIAEALRPASRILLLGAGGGYDVLGAVPMFVALRAQGKTVHIGGISFTSLDSLPGCTAVPGHTCLFPVEAALATREAYCPEAWLARWFRERQGCDEPVWGIAKTGVRPLRAALEHLVERLRLDAIVLVDGGVDLILRGDETSIGTPSEDLATLQAARGLSVPHRFVMCVGFGTELREGIPHAQVLERVAELERDGGYLGATSLSRHGAAGRAYLDALAFVAAGQEGQRGTHIHRVIRSAMEGRFGADGSDGEVSPSASARRSRCELGGRVIYDLHTHYYPASFFDRVRDSGGDFSFGRDPTGRTIITYRGARFFGITPPMTDPLKRIEEMDRVGIDVEVVSLSTPNVFFVEGESQADVARAVNDAYAELIAAHPARFKGFASIPMDAPDQALRELERALGPLRMSGVILLSNIRGRPLTSPDYRPFFEEADRRGLCIFLHPMLPANAEPFGEYVLGPLVGFPFDTTLAVARMCYAGLFRDFPRIRWIVGHLGGGIPYLMERLDNGYRDFAECRASIDELPSTYLKRLYYDTVSFSPQALAMVRDLVGSDHMVMGSDFPHMLGSIDRAVSSIRDLAIPEHEKERIFSGTALAILGDTTAA